DVEFARLIVRLSGPGASSELALGAALASRNVGDGHVCLDLRQYAARPLPDDGGEPMPSLAAWLEALRAAPTVEVVGHDRAGLAPDDPSIGLSTNAPRPLVLDRHGRLYLWRYLDYECRLAS